MKSQDFVCLNCAAPPQGAELNAEDLAKLQSHLLQAQQVDKSIRRDLRDLRSSRVGIFGFVIRRVAKTETRLEPSKRTTPK